jgi:hypothetical protein
VPREAPSAIDDMPIRRHPPPCREDEDASNHCAQIGGENRKYV